MKLPIQCSGKIRNNLANPNIIPRVKTSLGSSQFLTEFPVVFEPNRPSAAVEVTCNSTLPGTVCKSLNFFTWWCTYGMKGGLSNNSDGSVTCSLS